MRISDGQVGALEIEITPAMIEAGVKAAAIYDKNDSLEMIVTDVFLQMSYASQPLTLRSQLHLS